MAFLVPDSDDIEPKALDAWGEDYDFGDVDALYPVFIGEARAPRREE